MLEAAYQGLLNILQLKAFFAMLGGVTVGTFTAVTPQGLGTPLMYALFLSVVIQWDPIVAIAFLIGMDAVSSTCSAYLPVLFGIPGGAGSQSTVLDGYPMGRRGEARRALGAAFTAGLLGSFVGTLSLALAVPVARQLILLLGSPELFVVTLWGLSMVSVLAGPRPIKGLISGALGLVLSVVGIQSQSGVMRFVFGEPYLLEGLPITIVALAFFGIPAALDLALTKIGIERSPAPLVGSLLQGILDAFRNLWLVIRCSFVGVWVGIIPGLGSQVVDWLAYGHAAQTCRGAKDSFGRGDVRGVIAPESANDAKDGGTLIPTLLLGVPGSLVSALFLFALVTMGFPPGPSMVEKHLDIIYSIVWVLGIASVIGAALGLAFANQLARLAQLPYYLIVPMILSFVLIGALSANRHPLDLFFVVLFGVVGYLMKRFQYPRPPLILGMILGLLMEKYLYISVARYDFAWLGRPAVVVLFLLVVTTLAFTIWSRREIRPAATSGAQPLRMSVNFNVVMTLAFLALFVAVIVVGWQWPLIAKLMPVYIAGIPGLCLAIAQVVRDLTGKDETEAPRGVEMDEVYIKELPLGLEIKRTLAYFTWFAGAALSIWLLGIVIALPLFVFLYTLVEGRRQWSVAIAMALGAYLLVWGLFEGIFDVRWPPGKLFEG